MGFEHTFKVDIATARRAEKALTAFWFWARNTDPDAADKLLGIGRFHVYEDLTEEIVDVDYVTDPVQVREYFNESEWPAPGEGLIHWPELPFFHMVSPEAREALYRISEEIDSLVIWKEIIQAGEAADARSEEAIRRFFGAAKNGTDGVTFLDFEIWKGGFSRD